MKKYKISSISTKLGLLGHKNTGHGDMGCEYHYKKETSSCISGSYKFHKTEIIHYVSQLGHP